MISNESKGGEVDALPDWSLLPSGGVIAILVYFVIRILNQVTGSHESQQKILTAQRKGHEENVKEINVRHKEEIEVFQVRLANLDNELIESRKREQELRRSLWRSEDLVAEYRRRLEIPYEPHEPSQET